MSEYKVQKYILSICKNTLPFIPEKIWCNNEFIYVNFHKYNSKMQFFYFNAYNYDIFNLLVTLKGVFH